MGDLLQWDTDHMDSDLTDMDHMGSDLTDMDLMVMDHMDSDHTDLDHTVMDHTDLDLTVTDHMSIDHTDTIVVTNGTQIHHLKKKECQDLSKASRKSKLVTAQMNQAMKRTSKSSMF